MSDKICIKDSVRQINSFWALRTQIFIPNNIFGQYFDEDGHKLLVDKDLCTFIFILSNDYRSQHYTTIAYGRDKTGINYSTRSYKR